MTAYIDAHVHPPVEEYLNGPLAPFLDGLRDRRGYDIVPMPAEELVDYYESRDARAVLLGWDSQSVSNLRPFSSTDVAQLVARAPATFWGLGAVDPSKGAAAVAQVHEASRLGLAGISLGPAAQGRGPADRMTNPVWEAAAEHDLICMFHTGTTLFGSGTPGGGGIRLATAHPLEVDAVAARLPELRIVITHGGGLWLDEALAVAIHKSNVYVCLGGQSPARLGDDVIDAILGPLADRVIFGSGFPFGEPDVWIEKWLKVGLSEDVTSRFLCGNAAALLGNPGA